MGNREVQTAFEILTEELDALIPELNKKSSELMIEQSYYEARKIIDKAETLVSFRQKVVDLREEWLSLEAMLSTDEPLNSDIAERKIKSVREKQMSFLESKESDMLVAGINDSNESFQKPILEAILHLGGSATFDELIQSLESKVGIQLSAYDREVLEYDGKTIRWVNGINKSKSTLRSKGYLADSSYWIWKLSPLGEQVAKGIIPLNSSNAKSQRTRYPKSDNYDLDFHMNDRGEYVRGLYEALATSIHKLSPDITVEYKKKYISFIKRDVSFVQAHFQSIRLKIWIKPHISLVKDPKHLGRDVSKIGHYGTGLTEIDYEYIEQLEDVMDLISQSYMLVK